MLFVGGADRVLFLGDRCVDVGVNVGARVDVRPVASTISCGNVSTWHGAPRMDVMMLLSTKE